MVLFSLMFMAVIADDFVVNAEAVSFAKILHFQRPLGRNYGMILKMN